MLYLLSTSCVLTLASSLLFPLGYATAAQFLPTRGSSLSATRTTRTSRHSSPSRRPCGALLSFGEFYSYLYFASAVSDIFVIYVINNIRIRFIISYSWYVLWYTVHSVVYTCDLILARIWLLGLCPFINRVLHEVFIFIPQVDTILADYGKAQFYLKKPTLINKKYRLPNRDHLVSKLA